MSVLPSQGIEQRDGNGRWLPGATPRGARPWQKGQAPNPTGRAGEFQRCQSLCRKASLDAAQEIIRLSSQSDDDRVRYMASAWVYEHAWGKPKDYDPAAEKPDRPAFNPRDYTPEQLAVIEAALRLMKAGGSAPAEPEATAMSGDTIGMRTQFHRNESEDRGLGIR